ncbi:MAG: hypothetical protein QXQ41_04995, partial [Candidatus Bathyarchaeia archaeon]
STLSAYFEIQPMLLSQRLLKGISYRHSTQPQRILNALQGAIDILFVADISATDDLSPIHHRNVFIYV